LNALRAEEFFEVLKKRHIVFFIFLKVSSQISKSLR
jgi:hypothetical protein